MASFFHFCVGPCMALMTLISLAVCCEGRVSVWVGLGVSEGCLRVSEGWVRGLGVWTVGADRGRRFSSPCTVL